jgi:hypothetical protein
MKPAQPSSLAKLWRRVAPKNRTSTVATVCVFFAGLLALGLYRAHTTSGTASAPRFGVGFLSPASVQLDPNDPVARFIETGVGHVLFAPLAGDHCQRVLFDNRTGMQYEARSLDCSRPAAEVVASTDRIGALRRTFQQK